MGRGGYLLADSIEETLKRGEDQYFCPPHILIDHMNQPVSQINEGDSVIFCCRRGEREVQLTRAFVDSAFNEFPHIDWANLHFATLTQYHEMFAAVPAAFPPTKKLDKVLGEILSEQGLSQLRVAESEKFNHITTFLNGGRNRPFPGEDRIKIPSPRDVKFDQVPEMSSAAVTQAVLTGLAGGKYDFVAVNFANGDVIGHIDNFEAKLKCAATLDSCLGQILAQAEKEKYTVIISADHGLLETGFDSTGEANLHHTTNQVPFYLKQPGTPNITLRNSGILSDIAPTILALFGIEQPPTMTSTSLLANTKQKKVTTTRILFIIMDGWGIGNQDEQNPIFVADTPVYDRIQSEWAFTALEASGGAVGLLDGNPGNSEAGHMNIGAGKIVLQDEIRIEHAIQTGSLQDNQVIKTALETARANSGHLHLIAFLSLTSSHGKITYPLEILRIAKMMGLQQAYVHAIFNRPNGTAEAAPYLLRKMTQELETIGLGEIVTGIGRGLALDRDGDYKKTKLAYDAMVYGMGEKVMVTN